MNQPTKTLTSDRRIVFWLILTLATIYLFFFSGRFHSIDEVSSVALTDTLIIQGEAHTDQITWSQNWPLPQGTYGRDGHLYSKKGIGLSLVMAPLQWLAHWLPGVGVVGMVMMTNLFVTVLTGALLYLLVRRLHYAQQTAFFVALAWGLGTFALVYSKMLFNSPLVALTLLFALLALVPQKAEGADKIEILKMLLAGMAISLMLLTRPENALLVPFVALFLFLTSLPHLRLVRVILFGLPITLTVAFIFYFNWFRFGSPLDFGYDMGVEALGGDAIMGSLGILFSPGRSLFVYMPLLLPALWGFLPRGGFSKQPSQRALRWLVLACTVVYFILFAPSADWWGGWNWGSRYWLPLLPLWCLGLAPLWERPRWRWPLLFIVMLSTAIQLLGVLVDFNRPLLLANEANISIEAQLWTWQHSQLRAHLTLLTSLQEWDLVWAVTNSGALAMGGILLLMGMGWGLRSALMGRQTTGWALIMMAAFLGLIVLTQRLASDDPFWKDYHADLEPLVARLESETFADVGQKKQQMLFFEMLLYRPYFHRAQAWLNINRSRLPHIQILQESEPEKNPVLGNILERSIKEASTIYLATEGTPAAHENSGTERWLSQHAFLASNEWLGPETRLTVFYMPHQESLQNVTEQIAWQDGIVLQNAAHNATNKPLKPTEPLFILLTWQAEQPPTSNYTIFVQLIAPTGVIAQQDNPPQAGFAPTSTWQAKQSITDRRALLLPATLPPGDYSLIVGLYDETAQRLPLANGEEVLSLGSVRVQDD